MVARDQFVRQFLDTPIVHSTPNTRVGDPHPDFTLPGLYLFELSPVTNQDDGRHLHPNSTFAYFGIPISEIEDFRMDLLVFLLEIEIVNGKNYPSDQFNLVLRHCITGLLPDINFLHNVEDSLCNRLHPFRMRYHARGMIRYPGNRTREKAQIADYKSRGKRLKSKTQRAEKEHLRSSQRAATKTLARRLTNANASMEEIANQVQQLRAAQAPTTERLRRRHEDERLEFQAYLEEEIPRTDV
ncbi:hypothetical protein GQ600_5160 [Phytophthora cactorum]|nr:hypothetical protein GQ600_5160 [Phytophthora cactorum]